jgi:GT2 family glycosyltransferase
VRRSSGEIIAFTDDDCTAPPDWVSSMVDAFARETDAGILCGAADAAPHDPSKVYVPWSERRGYRRVKGRFARLQIRDVGSKNMALRREVFELVGGFDECLGPGAPFQAEEDPDLLYRSVRLGYVMVVDPSIVVVHWGARSYEDGSVRRLLRGYFYGAGARHVKHMRCGDVLAFFLFFQTMAQEAGVLLNRLLRLDGFTGAGRMAYFFMGALRSLKQPVDRKKRLYVSAAEKRYGPAETS